MGKLTSFLRYLLQLKIPVMEMLPFIGHFKLLKLFRYDSDVTADQIKSLFSVAVSICLVSSFK